MDHIKIEKNVPLPDGITAYRRYDWGKLSIGDSFVVDGWSERLRIRSSFIRYRDSKKCHFPPRTVLVSRDIGNDQYRFWIMQNA
jgi:hypothetical protein